MFGRIDHSSVAVEDLDAAIELYRDRFDIPQQHLETGQAFGGEAVLLECGQRHVEPLRPLSGDPCLARFLQRSRPGLHHVAYGTDDIDADLEHLREAGLRLLDEEPRRGIRGSRVAFLHPKATAGVLTELVEAAP